MASYNNVLLLVSYAGATLQGLKDTIEHLEKKTCLQATRNGCTPVGANSYIVGQSLYVATRNEHSFSCGASLYA